MVSENTEMEESLCHPESQSLSVPEGKGLHLGFPPSANSGLMTPQNEGPRMGMVVAETLQVLGEPLTETTHPGQAP